MATLVQLKADDFSVSDVSGKPGQPVSLAIDSSPGAPDDDLFTIMGLPSEVRLSAGTPYNDFWIVKRRDLHSLSLISPEGFSGSFKLSVTRARTLSRPPLTLNMNISISNAPAKAEAPRIVSEPKVSEPKVPEPKGLVAHRQTPDEKILFDKAYDQFKKGDVAGARAVFEYLAMKGDATAAIAMGETYDPAVLSKLFVKGLHADQAKATSWYRKAEQLGDPEAKPHLDALNQK